MTYRVFARKYRPQRFTEIVGQGPIVKTLQNAITTGKLAQAYLFVGPRGVGKTSTARIFAKALNCYQGPTIDPCGTCAACLEIAEGRNLDVLEIDGASNNSVENIRTLRESAAFAPLRGPYKIYLIDEVHMLSTAAFNALLKTLEEPPAHVKFLFATTEAQKLPATITSRCQRFDLRRLSEKDIATHLLYIAEQEKITLHPEAAQTLAHGADGALRDAESMLDQAVAFCGTEISATDVQHIFGFTPRDVMQQLGTALLSKNIPAVLALITSQSEQGKDLARLLNDLITFFRDLLIESVHPSAEETSFSELAREISSEKLLLLLEELGKAEEQLRWASDKKLKLDVALIKAVHLLGEVSLSDVLDTLTAMRGGKPLPPTEKKTLPLPKKKEVPLAPAPVAPVAIVAPIVTASLPPPIKKEVVLPKAVAEPIAEPVPQPPAVVAVVAETHSWDTVAAALAAESRLKFGWIASGKFLEKRDHKVLVEFPPSCEAQTETLFWPQARKKIQEALSKNLGEKVELLCSFTGEELPEEHFEEPALPEPPRPREREDISKKPSASSPSKTETSGAPATASTAPALTPEELESFKNDPLIKKALEIFQAEIILR
jgi:DNA polymerase-3 subunit gamma/tau